MSTESQTGGATEEFGRIVADLASALEYEGEAWIARFHGEDRPWKMDFSYVPREKEEEAPASPDEIAPRPATSRSVPANTACTLCPDRTYPLRRFSREGRLPVLVLHYNGPFRPTDSIRDRSADMLFGSEEEERLYERMLGALELKKDDFHYLQYPGCVFNAERSLPEDWNRRCGHCVTHVNRAVAENEIRLLLLFGLSAVFLLSEDRARSLAQSGEVQPIPLDAGEVPALVLRSPAAVLALEHRRAALAQKGKETEDYRRALEEEKRVKQSMLDTLRSARGRFL